MAFTAAPGSWIGSWAEDGTNITVPIASFPEMTAAEADGTTGDIRKVMFAIDEKMFQTWNSTASADRPTKMTIQKSASVNTTTGQTTVVYTHTFVIANTGQEVVAEA